jgi:signal transduction histidine kinase
MVGHQAAVVSMHLGAAELHLASDPAATAKDLVAARAGVQGVLRETQRILEILRLTPGEDGVVPLADQLHLEALIDSFKRAGLPIEASLDQLPDDAAADVNAALYRTVEEALTNAQKHGTGTTRISLRIERSEVHLEVRNPVDPALPVPSRRGYGLVGMRERVTSAGGTLREYIQHGEFVLHVSMRLDAGPIR